MNGSEIAFTLGSPVLGAWSDRYGRKFFIWFSSLTGGVAVQIAALTTNFGALIVTRLLTGLSTASAFPATLGLLSAETSTNESLRGRVMGLYTLVFFGASPLGTLLLGTLAQGVSEPFAIWVGVAALSLFFLVVWFRFPELKKLE